jgi:glycerophosphoryl diester phosphodiesterase
VGNIFKTIWAGLRVSEKSGRFVSGNSEIVCRVKVVCYGRVGRPALAGNIEIKSTQQTDGLFHPDPETFVRLLQSVIPDSPDPARITIQSFDLRPLQLLHKTGAPYAISLLVDEHEDPEAKLLALGFTPDAISPYYRRVDVDLIRISHPRGMRVLPWTVKDAASMRQLAVWGVDGLITDDPGMTAAVLHACGRSVR